MVIHSNFRLSLFPHLFLSIIVCVAWVARIPADPVGPECVMYVLVSLLCMRLVTLREGSCGWYDDDEDDE